MNRRLFLAALPAALLVGCSFQLRRLDGIPFATLYIDAPAGSAVAKRVRGLLATSQKTRLVTSAADAEAVLSLAPESRSKTILSLSGAGRVTEYRLALQLTYSLSAGNAGALTEPESLELNRDMTYDDAQLLAKEAEEQLLYRDMEESAARRIVRRLQSIKSGTPR